MAGTESGAMGLRFSRIRPELITLLRVSNARIVGISCGTFRYAALRLCAGMFLDDFYLVATSSRVAV